MARNPVLILGPTASGKSALALRIARERDAVIVNADSMQIYGVLRVLTARPGDAALSAAPHRLYGHVDPGTNYSTGMWMRDAANEITAAEGRPLVFVGGTGLYFKALLGGLADMPPVPDAIREKWRRRLGEEGPEKLHEALREADPELARTIRSGDGQRIVRALEIGEATGIPLSQWQKRTGPALFDPGSAEKIVVMPDRATLHQRIGERFDRMLIEGAIEEVEALLARNLDTLLPAMKAIGVAEIAAALRGQSNLADAVEHAKARTRQYAKRQTTWVRHQTGPDWRVVD